LKNKTYVQKTAKSKMYRRVFVVSQKNEREIVGKIVRCNSQCTERKICCYSESVAKKRVWI